MTCADQSMGGRRLPSMSGGGWGEFGRRRLAESAAIFIAIARAYCSACDCE